MVDLKRPFNDIIETNLPDMTAQEAKSYKNRVKADNGTLDDVTNIKVLDEGNNNVSVEYSVKSDGPEFERIRRITGYLVGTMNRWNDSKNQEEKNRVKHF